MSLNWQRLRPWNGLQHLAFEELCCQLAAHEEVPQKSTFFRKGTPDGGVECFWKLPDGKEWAWQAKFFESPPKTDWGNLDTSVKRALETHENLQKYTICLPFNPPDPRSEKKKSFTDRWNNHVEKWEKWALEKGKTVEFPPFWDETQIWERLVQDKHQGRRYFWFNEKEFSREWLQNHLKVVLADAGERYAPNFLENPDLNIKLPITSLFDGIGRTEDYWLNFVRISKQITKTYSHIIDNDIESIKEIDDLLNLLSANTNFHFKKIDFDAITRISELALKIVRRLVNSLKSNEGKINDRTIEKSKLSYLEYHIWNLIDGIEELRQFAMSDEAFLSNNPSMLLVGEALIGKTHLFCDIAERRIKNELPTILILGQHFLNLDNPWNQILKELGLSCTREEFIGALDAWAEAKNSRILLMIDAINEGNGKLIWYDHLPGFLEILDGYPKIGVALSVRSSDLTSIVRKDLLKKKLTRINHPGFQGVEHLALSTYCNAFELLMPSIPFLYPEFLNPGFLYLLCKTLKNRGEQIIPTGTKGFCEVFEDYLSSVHEKLWHPTKLNYPEESNLIQKAIYSIIETMVQNGTMWVEFEEAQKKINALLPGRQNDKSLFQALISEGLFIKDRFLMSSEEVVAIRFTYQKFENHFIAKFLLDKYLNEKEPLESFSTQNYLGKLIKDEWECNRNRYLIEAFSTQIPERIKTELFDIAPHCAEYRTIREAFIQSLIWRDPNTIGSNTLKYVNEHVIQYKDTHYQYLNALLTVAPIPEHPYNADFLHRNLMRFDLAKRDVWWSIFLHDEYGDRGAVDRLIDWAWSIEEKSHISDKSIKLCGIALAWFLTSSNRYLRDRATKALINLFSTRIHVLIELIREFLDVNDPYVKERLFAVAYGCAMRCRKNDSIMQLAENVYSWIFKNDEPPPHILLRDYARGVIERALSNGIKLDIEIKKIRPPYKSEFPNEPLSIEELKELYDNRRYSSIWSSLMYDSGSLADFGRYIVNSALRHWSSLRFGESPKPTGKEIYERFVNSFNKEQKKLWDEIQVSADLTILAKNTEDFEFKEIDPEKLTEKGINIRKTFEELLTKKQREVYNEIGLLDKFDFLQDENRFDTLFAQRWIFQRVIDLGWTPDLFNEFDRNLYRGSRKANKAERIGKKYQWIALHEFLARVSDNYELKKESWSDNVEKYDGPWQFSIRDIDPSCLLKSTKGEDYWEPHTNIWWFPVSYDTWEVEADDVQWLQSVDDLPKIESLIPVINPKDNSNWLTLEAMYTWGQSTPPEEERYDVPHREIWYWLKSYIVKKTDIDELFKWAVNGILN